MTGDLVQRRALVSGEVQGVFFRDGARRQATEHGVAGSARNLPDGRVEVVLEGPEPEVAAVVAWLHHGTPQSRVASVEVTEEPAAGLTGFRVG
jgi:acylphosphatase